MNRAFQSERLQLDQKRQLLDQQREDRLAQETAWNVRLLQVKHEDAQMELRIKKISSRKRLREEGWSESDIELACPM